MTSNERNKIANEVISKRWNFQGRNWFTIANEHALTPKELRVLRLSTEYQNVAWAEYGRHPYIFNKHPIYEHCIIHLRMFFGIPRKSAVKILGNDWKEPKIKATQLQINLIGEQK